MAVFTISPDERVGAPADLRLDLAPLPGLQGVGAGQIDDQIIPIRGIVEYPRVSIR